MRLEPPVLLGAGCLVEAGAELIGPLIIGDGCVVERGAVLEGVIHWDGAKAGRDSHLAGSILGRNVVVHHEAVVHEDAVIGDRSEVGAARARGRRRAAGAAHLRRTRAAHSHGDGADVIGGPRVQAKGALDGLLDLVFPRRCVVCRAAGLLALRDLRRRTCTRCRTTAAAAAARPLRRAGRPARTARPGGVAPPPAGLPRVRRPRPRLLRRPPRRSATTGRRGRSSPPASSAPSARSPTTWPARAAPAFAAAAAPAPRAEAVVTSVPAHRDHRLDRGFDLAESLARRLAREAGLAYAPLLRRVRHGARQSGLDRAARAANVHHAFALREAGFGVGTKTQASDHC